MRLAPPPKTAYGKAPPPLPPLALPIPSSLILLRFHRPPIPSSASSSIPSPFLLSSSSAGNVRRLPPHLRRSALLLRLRLWSIRSLSSAASVGSSSRLKLSRLRTSSSSSTKCWQLLRSLLQFDTKSIQPTMSTPR